MLGGGGGSVRVCVGGGAVIQHPASALKDRNYFKLRAVDE